MIGWLGCDSQCAGDCWDAVLQVCAGVGSIGLAFPVLSLWLEWLVGVDFT
jgi:hypothetical protein